MQLAGEIYKLREMFTKQSETEKCETGKEDNDGHILGDFHGLVTLLIYVEKCQLNITIGQNVYGKKFYSEDVTKA